MPFPLFYLRNKASVIWNHNNTTSFSTNQLLFSLSLSLSPCLCITLCESEWVSELNGRRGLGERDMEGPYGDGDGAALQRRLSRNYQISPQRWRQPNRLLRLPWSSCPLHSRSPRFFPWKVSNPIFSLFSKSLFNHLILLLFFFFFFQTLSLMQLKDISSYPLKKFEFCFFFNYYFDYICCHNVLFVRLCNALTTHRVTVCMLLSERGEWVDRCFVCSYSMHFTQCMHCVCLDKFT